MPAHKRGRRGHRGGDRDAKQGPARPISTWRSREGRVVSRASRRVWRARTARLTHGAVHSPPLALERATTRTRSRVHTARVTPGLLLRSDDARASPRSPPGNASRKSAWETTVVAARRRSHCWFPSAPQEASRSRRRGRRRRRRRWKGNMQNDAAGREEEEEGEEGEEGDEGDEGKDAERERSRAREASDGAERERARAKNRSDRHPAAPTARSAPFEPPSPPPRQTWRSPSPLARRPGRLYPRG